MDSNPEKGGITGPIALALSGGGYRAAAFHLGTMAYLDRVDLLPHVSMLSTVSGGTFTGAKYALSLADGISFEEFFKDFYTFTEKTHLVERAFDHLGRKATGVPSGRRNVIVSMAQVYAETFLAGADGQPRKFESILDADIHLKEITFNTTEFRHGIDFRFQTSENPNARIGNYYFSVPREEAGKVRVADIVAASSCFPGGFEPIAFPDDFAWPDGKVPPAVREEFTKPIGLMDGGIYDNQGIESLLLADERDDEDLDMFIISDVDPESDDLYPMPEPSGAKAEKGLTLGGVNLLAKLLTITCVLTVLVIGYQAFRGFRGETWAWWDYFLYLIPVLLAGGTAWALWWTRSWIREEALPLVPQVGLSAWDDLKLLSVRRLSSMLKLRVSSLLAMASLIFMKRIRSLVYGVVYRDKDYQGKRVSNLIYHLRTGKKFADLPGVEEPSAKLHRVADVAAQMPTMLWFEEGYQLPCVVSCGQATICYNLMKYLVRKYGKDTSSYPEDVRATWMQLVSDWKSLVEDPYALLKSRLPGMDLPLPK